MISYRRDLVPPVRVIDGFIPVPKRRPKDLKIDEEQLGRWARSLCSIEEIAGHLGCSVEQARSILSREPYRSIWNKGQADVRFSLRQRQLVAAMSIDRRTGAPGATAVAMLIHLGKVVLDQAPAGSMGGGNRAGDAEDDEPTDDVYELSVSLRAPRPHGTPTQTLDRGQYTSTISPDQGQLSTAVDVPAAGKGHLQSNGSER